MKATFVSAERKEEKGEEENPTQDGERAPPFNLCFSCSESPGSKMQLKKKYIFKKPKNLAFFYKIVYTVLCLKIVHIFVVGHGPK